MDKTKLAAVGFLVVLGGALLFARQQEAARENPAAEASAAHDHDGDGVPDHGPGEHGETAPEEAAPGENAAGQNTAGKNAAGDSTSSAASTQVTKLETEDVRKGTGATAEPGDRLTMNYRGTLLNGKEFDSSYGREPFQFQLGAGEVIPGWDQGIQGMKVGGKRKLRIPAELAYGAQSPSPDIPANSPLLFEVELLDVQKSG